MSTEYGTGHEVPWPLFVGDGAAAARTARSRAGLDGTHRSKLVAALAEALAADSNVELASRLHQVSATALWFAADVLPRGNVPPT